MRLLAVFIPEQTQAVLNTSLWALSAALQLALFIALFKRGLARRVPVFTTLIGFYLARSLTLYFIFSHIDLATYHALYDNLQIADILLQGAVAIEIALHLMRSQPGWGLHRGLTPMALLALAIACTIVAAALLPTHAPIPADRAQLFFSFLMVLLFVWSLSTTATLIRNIAAGFALYGIVNLSASFGRTYAALHENAIAYAIWSYTLALIYMVIVVYWLLSLVRVPRAAAEDSAV